MWKLLFEFIDHIFSIIPNKKLKEYLKKNLLFDYKKKLNTLLAEFPSLKSAHMRLAKGGGSIVFIFDNKITFKVRKYEHETYNFERFIREKRITDAISSVCTIKIPHIELIDIKSYTFYKTDFIPGVPLANLTTRKIKKHLEFISKQLAHFIYKKSLYFPEELLDLSGPKKNGYSWVHSDMCSNILIDPKTMIITGIIDWEWAKYKPTEDEFNGLIRGRKKICRIGLDKTVSYWYHQIIKDPTKKVKNV